MARRFSRDLTLEPSTADERVRISSSGSGSGKSKVKDLAQASKHEPRWHSTCCLMTVRVGVHEECFDGGDATRSATEQSLEFRPAAAKGRTHRQGGSARHAKSLEETKVLVSR